MLKSDNNPDDGGSPQNAVDLNFLTYSKTSADLAGKTWFRFQLDQIHCVKQVVSFKEDSTVRRKWTCTGTECNNNCEGDRCSIFALTVYVQTAVELEDFPAFPDCKYGDTVQVARTAENGNRFTGYEFAIIVQGEDRKRVVNFRRHR